MENANDLHPIAGEAVKDEVVLESRHTPSSKPLKSSIPVEAAGPGLRILADEIVRFLDRTQEAEADLQTAVVGVIIRCFVGIGFCPGKDAKQPHYRFFFLWRLASSCRFFSQ